MSIAADGRNLRQKEEVVYIYNLIVNFYPKAGSPNSRKPFSPTKERTVFGS